MAPFLIRFRWPILAVVLIVTIWADWTALGVKFDFSPRSIFLTRDADVEFLAEHRAFFGDEDGFVQVLLETDDVFSDDALAQIVRLTDSLGALDRIDKTLSLSTMYEIGGSPGIIEVQRLLEELPTTEAEREDIRNRALGNRLFVNRFVNPDGTAAAIMVLFDEETDEELERRPVLAEIEAILASDDGPATTTMVGVPMVNRTYATLLASDMARTMAVSTLLLCIVLFILFRNIYSVVLPGLCVGISVGWMVAYMVLAGDGFNIINAIVPTLLLVIGVGDAVHFLTTYYQALGAGQDRQGAVKEMVTRIGAACFLTSVTAAVGFGSLIVARIDIIKGMGRVAAVGLMLSYLVILLVIPAVLSVAKAPTSGLSDDPSRGLIGAMLTWIAELTIRRKGLVIVLAGGLSLLCIAGGMRVRTDNFLLEELFPHHPLSVAMHHTEEVMTGVMPVEISFVTGVDGGMYEPDVLRGMVELQKHLEADPFIGHTISFADLVMEITHVMEGERRIPDTRKKVAQYVALFEMSEDPTVLESTVDIKRSRGRITASQKDWGTKNFFAWFDGSGECDPRARCGKPVKTLIGELYGVSAPEGSAARTTDVRVTGGNLVAANALGKLVTDMLNSLGTAFIVICLLMMVLLRSFRVGLIAMIPNVLPLLITIGFMGWAEIPIRTSTALIFSVALGVAANDTVHFTMRFREELFATKDREEAVRRTMLSSGRAIIFTSVLLVFGFLTMMTTHFVGIFQMGVLGSVTLLAALLGDLLILPVCLIVFRPWSRHVEGTKV
ncbi:MAG: MMPL family transporter [Deltaproteobacteria bacterium]|nr:MMPL family transporter [Deltaproteobacteria bacterium]